ncbi:MAG TPA: cation:proton antiporter, partial [Alphaproteobacteria bacterium]|nr:cation:proton antiporter [Alphaproteobacteria bacterium]
APYFFVAIGLAIDITTVGTALWMTLALLAVVVLGKLIGAGIPAALLTSRRDGLLISVSMVPRAEIYLIVLLHGVNLGAWAIPKELYTAGVIVSLLTCIGSPVVVQRLLASKADVAEERTGEAG